MLKLGFHCLGLLKQRWTPSPFYTKHCLLSPQRSLSRDLSQNGYGKPNFLPESAKSAALGQVKRVGRGLCLTPAGQEC